MIKFYTPLLSFAFFALCLSLVCGELPFSTDTNGSGKSNGAANQPNTLLSDIENESHATGDVDPSNYDKRVERYAFGLGRRAFTYTNGGGGGVKRLPVYNFGLGKRARPYSFGLGKRAEYEDEQYDGDLDPRTALNLAYMDDKRNRPYSFGLGKREPSALEEVDRRAYPNRYGFGLGRR